MYDRDREWGRNGDKVGGCMGGTEGSREAMRNRATELYAETHPTVIWMGKTCFGQVEIGVDNEGAKKGVPKP